MKSTLLTLLFYVWTSCFVFGQADFSSRLSDSALELTRQKVVYDPGYFRIDYPNGDIPSDRGVCTDVIVRA
ncbi:MAG: DUF1287 domain-containing protein [Marinifilaceae bacterium]